MKSCKHCGLEKSLKAFYVNKNYDDGRTKVCKDCLYQPKIGRHSDAAERRLLRDRLREPKLSVEEDFWAQVEKTDGCWLWQGDRTSKLISGKLCVEYGQFRRYRAHRWSWILSRSEHPGNLFVCHSCDNALCVRPEHLFLGTARDNVEDMIKKGRAAWQKTQPKNELGPGS